MFRQFQLQSAVLKIKKNDIQNVITFLILKKE